MTARWPLRSPKGHKISVSGIQGVKLSHQDLELATYIDKSDADLKYLVKRNKFLWPCGIQHSELPVLCTEQSHSSLCLLLPHMHALLSLQQGKALACLYSTSLLFLPPSRPHTLLCTTVKEQSEQASQEDSTAIKLSHSLENFSRSPCLLQQSKFRMPSQRCREEY